MPIPILVGMAASYLGKKAAKKMARRVVSGVTTGAAVKSLFGGGGGGRGGGPGRGGGGWDIGKPGKGIFGSAPQRRKSEDGACPKGFHLNKHKLSDGTEPYSVCVRNRHVNYANGKAARRAGRRLRGTVKMLKKSFTFVTAHPKKGKFIVKKGR